MSYTPYSYIRYAADGSTNTFTVPFEYQEKGDVLVSVNGAVQSVSWLTSASVQLPVTAASLAGKSVLVQRSTPLDRVRAVFSPGGLDPTDLNYVAKQLLYATQEQWDSVRLFLASPLLPTTAPNIWQVKRQLQNQGVFSTVESAVPPLTSDPVNIAWSSRPASVYGDDLSDLIQTATGWSDDQMRAFYLAAALLAPGTHVADF